MKKFTFVGAMAVLVAISPFGRAQVNENAPDVASDRETSQHPCDFTIEHVIGLNSIISPKAPMLPAPVLADLQSGVLEIHQQFIYKSAGRTLEETAFVVPGGSLLPYPCPACAPVADHYLIHVDTAVTTQQPGASAVLTGKVISNDVPTPWGDITGAVVTLSLGYQGTEDGPIYETVSPLYGLYTPTGVGSVESGPHCQDHLSPQ
jgi:hypothetical protein